MVVFSRKSLLFRFVCLFVYVVVVLEEKNQEDNHLKCLNEKYTNLPGLSV